MSNGNEPNNAAITGRTTIITGHYGSGKTEFCVNYAMDLRRRDPEGEKILIADMDIINPYFRSREKAEFLAKHNIEVIGNNLDNTTNQDLPAISGQVLRAVIAERRLIVDLAGSEHGLKALSFFRDYLYIGGYELLVVLNVFREDCDTPRKMTDFIRKAEAVSGLNVTGLIHNSHLLHNTTTNDILEAQAVIEEVMAETLLPLKLTLIKSSIYDEISSQIHSPALVFDRLIMREEWQ